MSPSDLFILLFGACWVAIGTASAYVYIEYVMTGDRADCSRAHRILAEIICPFPTLRGMFTKRRADARQEAYIVFLFFCWPFLLVTLLRSIWRRYRQRPAASPAAGH